MTIGIFFVWRRLSRGEWKVIRSPGSTKASAGLRLELQASSDLNQWEALAPDSVTYWSEDLSDFEWRVTVDDASKNFFRLRLTQL